MKMHRRVRHNSEDSIPLAGGHDDTTLAGKSISTSSRTRRKGRSNSSTTTANKELLFLALMIVGLFIGAILLVSKQPRPSQSSVEIQRALPLSSYQSLQYALKNSNLVGLYFAASWCPLSTPVTNLIERCLGEILLPPLGGESNNLPPSDRAAMSLVYVSSDRDYESFQHYQGTNWMAVPFQSSEKDDLKRHFRVCSKFEVESLGIDRKFEIPTLLILDGETQTIITEHGVDDLEEYEEKALEHWMDLYNLMRAMEEKYTEGKDNDNSHTSTHVKQRYDHHADSFSSLFT